MKKKIDIICFIFLLFFLICAVSAADSENDNIQQIQQPDTGQDIYEICDDEQPILNSTIDSELSTVENEKLSADSSESKLQASSNNDKLESSLNILNSEIKVKLTAPDVTMYYNDGSKYTVTLKYGKKVVGNAKVLITINGKTYTKTTDKKGTASISLKLNSGTYTVKTVVEKNCGLTSNTLKNTVKIKSTIKAANFKKIYKNSSPYTATFYSKKGALLKNTAIKFKLNGKTYSVKTNKKGVASLNVNPSPGKHSISIINSKTGESVSKTITITPLITGNKDLTKYYKNTAEYKVKIINSNGKAVGKGKQVSFKVNGKTYKKTTDKTGYAKINVNLNPGSYTIKTTYGGCSVSNKITIKTLIESKDLVMTEGDGSQFNVKVLNSNGKAAGNQKVTFNVNNKQYSKTSDKNGIAKLNINLEWGNYNIQTQYSGLKATNKITVNNPIKYTNFTHTTLIPNYVNVTAPIVAYNSVYSLKTGVNGIIKMPKNELFTIKAGPKTYSFITSPIEGIDAITLGYKSYLIPFDGSELKSEVNKDNLKGHGIVISRIANYTQIDYISNSSTNSDLFGFYASKSIDHSETLTYMQNDKVMATVSFQTQSFDEMGLKYSLAQMYGKTIYDFNTKSYDEITKHNTESIIFTKTNEPVTFSYFGNYISGYVSQEDIITKFFINGKEELEKIESISYGLNKKYRNAIGFEVLQAYSIINEKITPNILNHWISKNSSYINRFGVMNLYGMHLTSLETTWLADMFADENAKEYGVSWKRTNTLCILGGINLDDTYLNILNADMGMKTSGNNQTLISLFNFACSIYLPYLEDYAISAIADGYSNSSKNSLDSIFSSIANNNYSVCQIGEMIYLFSNNNSGLVLNTSSGVCSVLITSENSVYKGSTVHTSEDCCSICAIPEKIINGVKNSMKVISPPLYLLSNKFEKIYPISIILEKGLKALISGKLTGVASVTNGLFTTMNIVQAIGSTYKDRVLDEKYWYDAMDKITFTRPGYLQGKKVYNIPNNQGSYDYIEVKINDDLTLDRNNAKYISQGKTKQLTKAETYQYFCEDTWTPFAMPAKYWDKSLIGG